VERVIIPDCWLSVGCTDENPKALALEAVEGLKIPAPVCLIGEKYSST
jgi:hypothetical protein